MLFSRPFVVAEHLMTTVRPSNTFFAAAARLVGRSFFIREMGHFGGVPRNHWYFSATRDSPMFSLSFDDGSRMAFCWVLCGDWSAHCADELPSGVADQVRYLLANRPSHADGVYR